MRRSGPTRFTRSLSPFTAASGGLRSRAMTRPRLSTAARAAAAMAGTANRAVPHRRGRVGRRNTVVGRDRQRADGAGGVGIGAAPLQRHARSSAKCCRGGGVLRALPIAARENDLVRRKRRKVVVGLRRAARLSVRPAVTAAAATIGVDQLGLRCHVGAHRRFDPFDGGNGDRFGFGAGGRGGCRRRGRGVRVRLVVVFLAPLLRPRSLANGLMP